VGAVYSGNGKLAEKTGAIPINFKESSSVDQIKSLLKQEKLLQDSLQPGEEKLNGILYGVDAVGYQAKDEKDPSHEEPQEAIDKLAELVDPGGAIGVIGVFFPQDPNGIDDKAKEGKYTLPFGKIWNKGLSVATGQTPVKKYNRQLRDLIIAGITKPSFIVSHHITIDEAPDAYQQFDTRGNGYTKVLIQFK